MRYSGIFHIRAISLLKEYQTGTKKVKTQKTQKCEFKVGMECFLLAFLESSLGQKS